MTSLLPAVWFWLVAAMLAAYVVFDGFDLGAGILHPWLARSEEERRLVLRSIGPVWDGNEVWLIAAGGTLYFAFPRLYASAFSGFYLPLMIVLWLLMLRGISIEFRNHIDSPVWRPFWDTVFSASSAALAVTFGAALGNVVRGVPLDEAGHFFEPLWTDFTLGPPSGILDWYTLLVGAAAFATLAHHGALWIAMKTDAALQTRARRAAGGLWWALLGATGLVTAVTFVVQPQVPAGLALRPWAYLFPALAAGSLVASRPLGRKGRDAAAFLASCAFIVGIFGSAVAGLYPQVLPARGDASLSLTVSNAAASSYGLKVGLGWWIPGILLVAAYFTFTYRHFAGKVRLEGEGY